MLALPSRMIEPARTRSPGTRAELILAEHNMAFRWPTALLKKVVGVQSVVAEELEERAMKVVASGADSGGKRDVPQGKF